MKEIEYNCPNCNNKLKKIFDEYICIGCLYKIPEEQILCPTCNHQILYMVASIPICDNLECLRQRTVPCNRPCIKKCYGTNFENRVMSNWEIDLCIHTKFLFFNRKNNKKFISLHIDKYHQQLKDKLNKIFLELRNGRN